jgi:hypothetical protein
MTDRPSAEDDAAVVDLDQHRAQRVPMPAPGEPAITFGMDDDRITFRDQAALDEYVRGSSAEIDATTLVKAIRMAIIAWNTLGPGKAFADAAEFIAAWLVENKVYPPEGTNDE